MPQTDPKKSDQSKMTSEEYLNRLQTLPKEEKVEELASLFFTISEIALFIGMKPDELKDIISFDECDPLSIAYRRGKLQTQIKLRFDTARFAASGSPAALEDMKSFLSKQNFDEDA